MLICEQLSGMKPESLLIHRSDMMRFPTYAQRRAMHTYTDRRADRGWGMFVLVDLHSMVGDIMYVHVGVSYRGGQGTGIPPPPQNYDWKVMSQKVKQAELTCTCPYYRWLSPASPHPLALLLWKHP